MTTRFIRVESIGMGSNAHERGGSARTILTQPQIMGLRDFDLPSLENVERTRWRLWSIGIASLCVIVSAFTLTSVEGAPFRTALSVKSSVAQLLLLSVAVALCAWMIQRENALRKKTRVLMDERVLSSALSNRLTEVSALSEVGKAINRLADLDETLGQVLDSVLDLVEVDHGSIMLTTAAGDSLVVACARHPGGEDPTGQIVRIGQGVAGWVAQNREPLLISGEAPDDFFENLRHQDDPIDSALSVPLISGGELLGVMNVSDVSGERRFSEYELRALSLVAEHAAMAIRNARTYQREIEAVRKLEEVDRLKSQFIATVSHELRTPLTGILGAAKTLWRSFDRMSDEQKLDFIKVMMRNSETLAEIVEDLLLTSRIESGPLELERATVDIVESLHRVVSRMERAGLPNPISIQAPAQLMILSNPQAVEQSIRKLISNASKHSNPEGAIQISVHDLGHSVRLDVCDSGPGIPEEAIPMIFDRFRQVDQSDTRRVGGVGLGLYITRNLLEATGAKLDVASRQGVGSTFTVTFEKKG